MDLSAGGRRDLDIALLEKLALKRLQRGLADLDAAAGKLPAGHIGVTDQEYGVSIGVVD